MTIGLVEAYAKIDKNPGTGNGYPGTEHLSLCQDTGVGIRVRSTCPYARTLVLGSGYGAPVPMPGHWCWDPGTEHPGTEHPGTEHPGTEHLSLCQDTGVGIRERSTCPYASEAGVGIGASVTVTS